MKATLIVPIYNEIQAVESELGNLFDSDYIEDLEVIIVDDGSTDGTSEKLASLCAEAGRENILLLRHDRNMGYGAALKTGIINASTDHIVITDADNSYPNDKIPALFELYEREGLDMVVGARTGKDSAIPLIRKPPKWFLNKLANFLAGTSIPDINSGLRIFRKDVVLDNFNLICDGFSFTTTLTLIMLCNSYKVKYVPISYYKRSGKSKIHPIRDTINFFYLICSTVMYFRPLRVFMPPSIFILAVATVLGIWQAVVLANITTVTVIFFQTGFILMILGLLADLITKSRQINRTRAMVRRMKSERGAKK